MKGIVSALIDMSKQNKIMDMNEKTELITGLEKRVSKEKELLSSIEEEYDVNIKKSISNLKRLKFVKSVSYDRQSETATILTADLIFKHTATSPVYNAEGNLGPYLIKIKTADSKNPAYDMRIERVNGSVKRGGDRFAHFYVYQEMLCFGTDGMYAQFNRLVKTGKLDIAMTLLWGLLSLTIGDNNMYPHIPPFSFMAYLKEDEERKKRLEEEARQMVSGKKEAAINEKTG